MPLITETYYLSLTQDNRGILRLRCSQDDTLRTVNLKLYNNGSIFVIPSGISASISGVKQNGAVFSKPCTISQNRESVVLQLSSDITNVDGIIVAEIVLNDGEGGRLGTSNFIIQVEKNPIRAGVVQDTETPIEYINDFIEKIQTLTARLNNLITPSGDPSLAEVVDARMGILDSTTYQTLGARLNAEFQRLSNVLTGAAILESTGDTADRTSEILSKLNVYGTCKLGKGDFYVNSLVMPEGSHLIGSGNSTRIILPSSITDGYVVKPRSNCIIENISFYGGFTGTHSELIDSSSIATRHCIILDRFNSVSSENVILSNVLFNNFVGSAIIQRYTTGCLCKDVVINMCYAGIDISNTSYDGLCTNVYMNDTRYGVVQNGSNFVFSSCISKDSQHHIRSDQQNAGCTFSSCTFFDSSLETTARLAFLSNIRNGFVFDNCMFDSSLRMVLNACDGIVIKGTNFVGSDTFAITVANSRNSLLLITDCIADVEPTVTDAGTAVRITSCYLKDGTAWTISEAHDGSGGSSTLAELTDTDISSEQDGQVLIYDGTSNKWVNRTPSDGSVEIEVDNELSSTSENPVQNKVINREISEIKADLDDEDDKVDLVISGIADVVDNNTDTQTTWTSGILMPEGVVSPNSSYSYSGRISVTKGDIIRVYRDSTAQVSTLARLTAYKNNSAVASLGGSNISTPLTIVDGIDEIAVTISSAYTSSYTPFFRKTVQTYKPKDGIELRETRYYPFSKSDSQYAKYTKGVLGLWIKNPVSGENYYLKSFRYNQNVSGTITTEISIRSLNNGTNTDHNLIKITGIYTPIKEIEFIETDYASLWINWGLSISGDGFAATSSNENKLDDSVLRQANTFPSALKPFENNIKNDLVLQNTITPIIGSYGGENAVYKIRIEKPVFRCVFDFTVNENLNVSGDGKEFIKIVGSANKTVKTVKAAPTPLYVRSNGTQYQALSQAIGYNSGFDICGTQKIRDAVAQKPIVGNTAFALWLKGDFEESDFPTAEEVSTRATWLGQHSSATISFAGDTLTVSGIASSNISVSAKSNGAYKTIGKFFDDLKDALSDYFDFKIMDLTAQKDAGDLLQFGTINLVSNYYQQANKSSTTLSYNYDSFPVLFPLAVDESLHTAEILRRGSNVFISIDGEWIIYAGTVNTIYIGGTELASGNVTCKNLEVSDGSLGDAIINGTYGIISGRTPRIVGVMQHLIEDKYEGETLTQNYYSSVSRMKDIFKEIKKRGYTVLSLNDICEWIVGRKKVPARSVFFLCTTNITYEHFLNDLVSRTTWTKDSVPMIIGSVVKTDGMGETVDTDKMFKQVVSARAIGVDYTSHLYDHDVMPAYKNSLILQQELYKLIRVCIDCGIDTRSYSYGWSCDSINYFNMLSLNGFACGIGGILTLTAGGEQKFNNEVINPYNLARISMSDNISYNSILKYLV